MKNYYFYFVIFYCMTIVAKDRDFQYGTNITKESPLINQSSDDSNFYQVQKNNPDLWQPLFNGEDLNGWIVFLGDRSAKKAIQFNKNTQTVFTVENNCIHMYKDFSEEAIVPEGFLASKKEYENYHLKLEFKWGNKKFAQRVNKKLNSGIMFHAQDSSGFWPTSVECQVMEGNVGDIYTQNNAWITTTVDSFLTDPATDTKYPRYSPSGKEYNHGGAGSRPLIHEKRLDKSEGWNTVEIIVRENEATFIVNGKINNHLWNIKFIDPENFENVKPLRKGRIILQAEATEIYYRNIMIKED